MSDQRPVIPLYPFQIELSSDTDIDRIYHFPQGAILDNADLATDSCTDVQVKRMYSSGQESVFQSMLFESPDTETSFVGLVQIAPGGRLRVVTTGAANARFSMFVKPLPYKM